MCVFISQLLHPLSKKVQRRGGVAVKVTLLSLNHLPPPPEDFSNKNTYVRADGYVLEVKRTCSVWFQPVFMPGSTLFLLQCISAHVWQLFSSLNKTFFWWILEITRMFQPPPASISYVFTSLLVSTVTLIVVIYHHFGCIRLLLLHS